MDAVKNRCANHDTIDPYMVFKVFSFLNFELTGFTLKLQFKERHSCLVKPGTIDYTHCFRIFKIAMKIDLVKDETTCVY